MSRIMTRTSLNHNLWFCLAVVLTLACLPAVSSAQTSTPDTATSSRPKAINDGNFTLKLALGRDQPVELKLRRFFQEGKSFKHNDAFVYYEPLALLVTDENGKIKADVDEKDNVLTLYIRWPEIGDNIRENFQEQMINDATGKISESKLGPDPYLIEALQPERVWLEFNKPRRKGQIVSDDIPSSHLEVGNIAVYFRFEEVEDAYNALDQLGTSDQLTFKYTFVGVSEEKCIGRIEANKIEEISQFRDLDGVGPDGIVTRKQTAKIGDEMSKSVTVESRCDSEQGALQMLNKLMETLETTSKEVEKTVTGWDQLEKLLAFDSNDFAADFKTMAENLENKLLHTTKENRLKDLSTEADTLAAGGGIKIGDGTWFAGLSAEFLDMETSIKGEAKRDFEDVLEKQGIFGLWEGGQFEPKQIIGFTKADLMSAWGVTNEFEYVVKRGADTQVKSYTLTPAYRTATMPTAEWRKLEERFEDHLEDRLEEILAKQQQEQQQQLRLQREVQNLRTTLNSVRRRIAAMVGDNHNVGMRSVRVDIKGDHSVGIRGGSNVSIDASGGGGKNVIIDGQPIGNIVRAKVCRYNIRRQRHQMLNIKNEHYTFDTERDDNLAVISSLVSNCDSGSGPGYGNADLTVEAVRRGGKGKKSENWILDIQHWHKCLQIDVNVLFLSGWHGIVERDGTHWPNGLPKNVTHLGGAEFLEDNTWCSS